MSESPDLARRKSVWITHNQPSIHSKMARVTTYLNFAGNTEEAFLFYKTVFKTDFVGPIMRFKDSPPSPGQPPVPEDQAKLVMHVALPILGGHVLMGTDSPESMGFKLNQGNNV